MRFWILTLLLLLTTQGFAKEAPFLFNNEDKLEIVVNNRILARVNGKPITVVDLQKKMDMLFYRQFPQYTSSVQARFQYYQANWQNILNDLIDKELLMADAEESKLVVSGGDVREELERLFGPNIIENLDKVGLTLDEALTMLREEIVIRRMTYFRVQMKARQKITPQDVRLAYEKLAEENIKPDLWRYQMITVRGDNSTDCAKSANRLHRILKEENVSFENLSERFSHPGILYDGTTAKLSDEFTQSEKEIPSANLEILNGLEAGQFSDPIAQKSRANNSMVFRIFYLKEMIPGGVVPYEEVAGKIKEKLIDLKSREESDKYFAKLRKHYNVHDFLADEMVPEGFEPFKLY